MHEVHFDELSQYISTDYLKFRENVHTELIPRNVSKAILNLLLKCPNEKSSKLSYSFHELDLFEKTDFIGLVDKAQSILKVKISNYIRTDVVLQDEWFNRFMISIEKSNSFVYMYKSGNHLESLFIKLRNAVAHGQYYIVGRRIILWNSSTKQNITALFHMSTNQFVSIVKILENAYDSKNNLRKDITATQ